MKKNSVHRSRVFGLCVTACSLMFCTAQALADGDFKYTVNSAASVCKIPKDQPATIDWRKFTEFLIAQNNLTSLYVRALEKCRPTSFDALAGRFATFGHGSDGENVCAPGPADAWKQDLAPQDEKSLKAFATSFANLLARLETGNPQPFGNGVFLAIRDAHGSDVQGAGAQTATPWANRVEKAASDFRAAMAAGNTAQGGLQGLCYKPSDRRDLLGRIVSGKAAWPPDHGQADIPSKPEPANAAAPPGTPSRNGRNQTAGHDSGRGQGSWDPVFSFTNLRLRAAPTQLAEVPTTSDGGGTDPALSDVNAELYVPGSQAKLSFQQNTGSNAVSNNIVGALGYSFTYKWAPFTGGITPYVATDREIKYANNQNKTPPNVSANTLDFGTVFSAVWDRHPLSSTTQDWTVNRLYLLVRPDWLKNFVDHSEIWSVNMRFVPLVTGPVPLNSLRPVWVAPEPNDTYQWTPLLDVRFQRGWFTARGNTKANLSLNEDFTRLGGMIGLALEANWIPGQPIDLSAQYIDFVPIQGFRQSLGYFQTQGTWYFGLQKAVGITASYENGRRLDTAQRYESWTIGLSFKL